ncbi:hypothetical protein SPRG_02108 [Saprolegnia parasitica CBS 223.65]|uniref:Uncharacterized protein n=1 Tax=Saprolegnia parasitica (strain CBS 223.65) TaxID=695850 RepID=A0A067CRI2_SAPPC|nr:hypothetical protein SPRG_02108 [Saprolegnia parasitica CBS 223.65]KDO33299.1 hypothetical protein SPRG_02108 [Saprolegnia parasitica CBS 223.65]|eukprot:XP_012196049.1 hypothetical protein SPRG_02108 [Saprolegnia parasitica CBS 223.65]
MQPSSAPSALPQRARIIPPHPSRRCARSRCNDESPSRSRTCMATGSRNARRAATRALTEPELDDRLSADGTINLEAFTYDDSHEFLLWKLKCAKNAMTALSGFRSALRRVLQVQTRRPLGEPSQDLL